MGSMHSHGTQRRMIPKGSNSFKIALQTQLCWDHHPIVYYTPHPAPKKNKQTTSNASVYTHPQHLPRWDSSTNGSQEMGRYIVHVAYRRESIAKLFGMRCIVPPHAHNLGAHLHQLVAQISCHFPLDLYLHIHQQQRSLMKKCLTLLFREKA